MGQDFVKEKLTQEFLQWRPLVVLLDLPSRRLDQPPVLDVRRAGGLAGATVETKIDVPDETLAQRQPAPIHLDHLIDPATRRVHFDPQLAIGWATVQTKAAVDTLRVELPRRLFAVAVPADGVIE